MIKEQVNLGRFLSAMNLENTVLSDGVLTSMALEERASLIQGIIKGNLENGEWQSAVWLVYNPGPAKALFDGNWEGFHDGVVASAKKLKKDKEISKELIQLLSKNKRSSGLICRLIDEMPYHKENLNNLYYGVYDMVDATVQARLRKRMGEKAFEAKDYPEAFRRFESDSAEMQNLYNALLESPSENMDMLLAAANSTKDKITEIVKKVLTLDAEEIQDIDLEYTSIEEKLYELISKYEVELTEPEWTKLRGVVSEETRHYIIEKTGDKKLALLWAKKHHKEHPLEAYAVFKEQEYKGDEVLEAVKTVFSKKWQEGGNHGYREVPIQRFQKEHLETVYPEQELWMRIKLAYHLEDKKKMLELSKESFEAEDYESAYNIWLRGEGELDCEYMDALRPEIRKIEEKKLGGITQFAFDRADTVGRMQYFEEIVDTHPFTAYQIAQGLEDEDRMQRAREIFVAKDPEYALERFKQKYHGPDLKGVEMSIEALAKKYEIPSEQIKQYVKVETE